MVYGWVWVDGWICRWWLHGWVDWGIDGWVNGWVDKWMCWWMEEWMDGYVNGYVGGMVGGQVYWEVDGLIYFTITQNTGLPSPVKHLCFAVIVLGKKNHANTVLTVKVDSAWQHCVHYTQCLMSPSVFLMMMCSRALLVWILQWEWSGALQRLPQTLLQCWDWIYNMYRVPSRQGHYRKRKWQRGWLLRFGIKYL